MALAASALARSLKKVQGILGHPLTADGCWFERRNAVAPARESRGLFLDRDGVIIEDEQYLSDPKKVRLIPGAREALVVARAKGWHVALVTNQSGIGRGMYGWNEFAAVQAAMMAALGDAAATIELVAACPHYPNHPWRKPEPGMIQAARQALGTDPAKSWMVGDKAADLMAARAAKLAGGFLVGTGEGRSERAGAMACNGNGFTMRAIDSIAALVPWLKGTC
jgi:D-glycero-D-manno-heptose 1,7-bisphosphate phosphatase